MPIPASGVAHFGNWLVSPFADFGNWQVRAYFAVRDTIGPRLIWQRREMLCGNSISERAERGSDTFPGQAGFLGKLCERHPPPTHTLDRRASRPIGLVAESNVGQQDRALRPVLLDLGG
jgi:hypothetical protein